MSNIIDSIREENSPFVKNSNFKAFKRMIVDNYNERAHFIYELLQNADDAGATKIRFEADEQMLTVIHDGKPFNEKDVEAICSIGQGTKKEDYTKIGRFGIGFKSVFAFTTCPEIHSGGYHFKIEDLIMPQHVKKTSDQRSEKETVFYIPLDVKTKPKTAYEQIEEKFNEMKEESILFLTHIKTIELSSYSGFKTITKECAKSVKISDDTVSQYVDIKVDSHNSLDNGLKEIKLKMFSKDKIELKDYDEDGEEITIKNQKCSIAYCIEEDELIEPDSAGLNDNYFVFFPTMIRNTFPLLVHAPFITKFSRDTFRVDSEANKLLKEALGELIADSIPELCKDKIMDSYIMDGIFNPLNDSSILNSIKARTIDLLDNNKRIIETADGKFTSINRAVFTDEDEETCNSMRKIIKVDWLIDNFECGSDYKFCYINEDSYFYNFINDTYEDMIFINREILLENFDKNYISEQSNAWLIEFINMLLKKSFYGNSYHCALSDDINLRDYPLIKLSDDTVIDYKESKTWNDLYLNTGIISEELLKDRCVRYLYSEIYEIKEYSQTLDSSRNALEKLRNGNISTNDYTNLLRAIIQSLKNKELTTEEISNIPFMRTYNVASKKVERKEPINSRIPYIKKADVNLYKLFNNVDVNVNLLLEKDHESFSVDDLKLLGCVEGFVQLTDNASSIIYLNRDLTNYYVFGGSMYIKVDQENADNTNFAIQKYYPEIERAIKSTMDKEKSAEIMKVAHYFEDSIRDYVEYCSAKTYTSKASYYGNKLLYSRLGLYLTECKWVYDKDNNLVLPGEIQIDQVSKKLYGNHLTNIVANKLGFKNSLKMQIEEIRDYAKNKGLEGLFIFEDDPAIMQELSQLREKLKKGKARKKVQHNVIEELEQLNSGSSYFSTNTTNDGDTEFNPIKDPDKRKDGLDKEFKDSAKPNKQTRYTRSTYRSNAEEKSFLQMEYDGRCQVCGTIIKTANNKSVFSAINLIMTNNLDDESRKAEQLAWNSLCLCFNCAAKFKYCDLSMEGFVDYVKKVDIIKNCTDGFDYPIRLNNQKVMLSYSPKHMQNLKVAIDYYEKEPVQEVIFTDDEENEDE